MKDLTLKIAAASVQFKPEKSKPNEEAVDSPLRIEVLGEISLFDSCYRNYEENVDEIKEIINDKQIASKKALFNVIHDRIRPSVEEVLTRLNEAGKKFCKWLKVRDNLIVTSSVKSKLEERLQKVVNAQSEWGNLAIEVSKIDRKFGFSASKGNFEHGGATLLSKKEIKTFYGEEPGHKWQDPYEWFAEVERQICRFTNDEEVKVYVVLSHLSPNICRLAKVQNFKTYEELKNWLIQDHVNETKVIKRWKDDLASMKPKKFGDVNWYITHIRGTLKTIKHHCYGKRHLQDRWFSDRNIYSLVKSILDQISFATKRKEYERFIIEVWSKVEEAAEKSGVSPTSEEHLEKLDEFLEDVKRYAKTREQMADRIESLELTGLQIPHEKEESNDYNSEEEDEDEAGFENESEGESEKEDAENGENFCEECIGCNGLFSADDLAEYNYNYEGWICWSCK